MAMTGAMKFLEWFLWGLCMGMGWAISQNVLNFIGSFMHGSGAH